MSRFLLISIVLHPILGSVVGKVETYDNGTQKIFVYNTYSYDKIIDLSVINTTTQILDFYEDDELWTGYPTRVHVGTNDSIKGDNPLFVTAAQQKSISSWELPLTVTTNHRELQFDDIARTLCPHDAGPNITSQSRPTLTLATSSSQPINVKIKLRRVKDFYLEMNKEVPLNLTPSTPKYYYFSFDRDPWNMTNKLYKGFLPKFNYTIPKSVLLTIESEEDVCAVISIQNNSCPVFDNEKDVMYQGYHFTMTTRGGITVTQSMFPKGFYVVVIVKESDEECTGVSETDDVTLFRPNGRSKTFRLKVVEAASTSDFLMGALASLALILLVTALAPLGNLLTCRHEELILIEESVVPSTSRESAEAEPMVKNINVSDTESEDDVIIKSLPMPLNVAGLSRHNTHSRKSNRYFWSALTVAVVYALPVVQLLFTYQRMVFQTGDQDVCYYNYLCAHPIGPLADFNHVYSNIGYIILGIAFMVQARCRHVKFGESQELGIPQHLGLFYSMGLALAMEGLLSACYHLCPNKMNFQFDSSFMYVIAVLCIVKLYQSRHPDVNASAHATFMLLALLMAIGFFGIMYPSVYFWVSFTIMHLAICFVFTFKIYYVGRFKMERGILPRAWCSMRQHGWLAFKPNYTARAVLLVIANMANIALASYGLYEHNKDFARHLLAILMGNTILYNVSYVVMKIVHREQIPAAAWLWLALAHIVWGVAAYLFLSSRTKWSQTPAQSRQHNAMCDAMRVFDTHDLWHLASAAAMFFLFNALLILDEPLQNTPRHLIPVF
ncbi:SID1 transmembrane family member 1-like isoform X1 [Pieris brassicae]|uniref:SID1 transmembrane family member 1-like isoform X1 n=1 Tax=Pieris brassicae TaxID=7116 RepID=UPI001E6602B8|nr:SID1 transmembrane family member 1-like isoform X1 [Pieris brassicae]